MGFVEVYLRDFLSRGDLFCRQFRKPSVEMFGILVGFRFGFCRQFRQPSVDSRCSAF